MTKHIQDMVPPDIKKSIRSITVDRVKRPHRNGINGSGGVPKKPQSVRSSEVYSERKGGFLKKLLWGGLSVVVLFIIFSFFFSGAKVVVTPRQTSTVIDATFSADLEGKDEFIPFQIMTISKDGSREVVALGEEDVSEKASGKIIVYNNYSENQQELIKNTRFETPEGLIYRIKDSIVVPGITENNKGETVPGSIEVMVYADSPGDEYNIGLTDFEIPGFKDQPQFFKFYARSKTTMAGGFIGKVRTASASDESSARLEMQTELREKLLQEAGSVVPEGFVLFPDAFSITFESQPNGTTDKEDMTLVKESSTLYAVLFDENILANTIAYRVVADYDGEDVAIANLDNLQFKFLGDMTVDSNLSTFEFSLQGNPEIVWKFDEQQLAIDLSGKPKNLTNTIFSAYPGIVSAEVTVRPFWKRSLPEKTEKIDIQEKLGVN
jgi:hypothetical protein